jgi:hypothetical protein
VLQGMALRRAQPQPLKCLNDRVEARGRRRQDRSESPLQVPLRGNDEIQAPEAYAGARDPADVVASHPRPRNGSDETRKGPYLAR